MLPFLYHLTLKNPSLLLHTVVGQFSNTNKLLHLVVSTSTGLEIFQPDAELGKLQLVAKQYAFAHVTGLAKVRCPGDSKDSLVVVSDSGNLSVCELDAATTTFVARDNVAMGKSGMTRFSPCSYVAVNERSHFVMVAALERTKLVYNMGMIRQSPVEHAAKNTWTLNLVALNTDHDKSVWAALEVTPDRPNDPCLNYYILDHGLNHLFMRPSALCFLRASLLLDSLLLNSPLLDSPLLNSPLQKSLPVLASLMVAMPGHFGGVVVCCESFLVYDPTHSSASPGTDAVYVALPVRRHSPATIITAAHVHMLKKDDFFVLLQSSIGDLFKLTASRSPEGPVLHVTYFDSLPACSSFNILKSGFLYANTLQNDKLFYQFESLGENNDTTCVSEDHVPHQFESFDPIGLQNLALVDILPSLGPLFDAQLLTDQSSDSPSSLLTLSSHSYLKTLTHGYPVTLLVSSPLPLTPSTIYTTKLYRESVTDQYLVLSSERDETTLVLSVGEVVEEAETELVKNQYTLGVQQTGQSSLVQIHRNGIRSIRHVVEDGAAKLASYTDWFPPAGITILHCSSNNEQVIIALSNREVCYFEIDPEDDQLIEYQERMHVEEGSITAIALDVGVEKKSRFAAVASSDQTVQVVSLAPHNCFAVLTLQALSFGCRSLLLSSLFLHMGMDNGVYVRVTLDSITGKLSDTRLKYLGAKPVHLRAFKLPNTPRAGILAISTKPWVGHFDQSGNLRLSPLIDCNISCGSSFFSEDIGMQSMVGIEGNNLTIFTVGGESGFDASAEFQISQVKLRYQPKKMARVKKLVLIIESEPGTVLPYAGLDEAACDAVDEEYFDAFGYRREEGRWASCIQVVDQARQEVVQSIELENNECAVALSGDGRGHVMVAASKDLRGHPSTASANYIYTFDLVDGRLQLLHKTKVEAMVTAMSEFSCGRIVVALHKRLRMYEMGRKQLLQKSVSKIQYLHRANHLIYLGGDTVVVGDGQASVSYVRFDGGTQQFVPLINDIVPRQITALASLDSRTVIAGDKFGNVSVSRISEACARDFNGNVLSQFQDEFLGGAGDRLSKACEFHIQDVPTSFSKGSFVQGGVESVVYTGLQGSVGVFVPMATVQEAKMMARLETLMREALDPDSELDALHRLNLVGRHHLKFRGYYNPAQNVVDGDFVELFYRLDQATKVKVAGSLDRTPREIERKIYDLRNRGAF